MRICAVSDVELTSRRAHAINVVKTAGGFARLGADVTLLCRALVGEDPGPLLAAFGEDQLRVIQAPAVNNEPWDERRQASFGAWAARTCAEIDAEFVYARHFLAALTCAEGGLPTVMETHAYIGDENPSLLRALGAARPGPGTLAGVVTISHRLRDAYIALGASPERVHVVSDGVDPALFMRPATLGQSPFARPGAVNVVYAGHLYEHKGIPTLLEAAMLRPNICIHLLGGMSEDIARIRAIAEDLGASNVHVHGWIEHRSVARWLWHADALVLPPSAREASKDWTSPVKLGEYLASGTPIVCSRIPALEDWVDERVVEWFEADDAGSLALALICIAIVAKTFFGENPPTSS